MSSASGLSRAIFLLCLWACPWAFAQAPAPAGEPPAAVANPVVNVETNLGLIVVELFQDAAPATVENFLNYVKSGFYSGVIVHRIVPGFVIQTGGFDAQYERKATGNPITNESTAKLKNKRGTLSMARLPNPDSATSQFFINLADNPSLDWRPGQPGYAVFGAVISGMQVVDTMAQFPQGNHKGVFVNAPNEPIVINSMTVVSTAPAP